MYYYYMNGYRVENDLSISTNEDGESIYTSIKTRIPIKRIKAGSKNAVILIGFKRFSAFLFIIIPFKKGNLSYIKYMGKVPP